MFDPQNALSQFENDSKEFQIAEQDSSLVAC